MRIKRPKRRTVLVPAIIILLLGAAFIYTSPARDNYLADLPGVESGRNYAYAKQASSEPFESCSVYLTGISYKGVRDYMTRRLQREPGWEIEEATDLKLTQYSKILPGGENLYLSVGELPGGRLTVNQVQTWSKLRYIANLVRTRGESKMVILGTKPRKVWWP